ncbi:DUF4261 domain-containing protein [Mucilaginibacter ginsenosidivorax]|uniref:DUF4261 domain-containing protein n=1 Tax=Mucilaginibacter ginsenosidivorax TaxID=862126 RepID=A0A5B8W883_9SPHI|nr:DUF4261 domain-containing protein [Mucilaginibacter ginsenosidivorax]QEC79749.1 DUF4261 domain-containing protein [Mucilaginibacter ginsenosidivorax]
MGLFNIFKKKTALPANEPEAELERLENFPELLMFKLLFINKPELNINKILTEAKTYFTNIEGSENEGSLLFSFPGIKIEFADAIIDAQCVIAQNENISLPETAFQQNWNWQEANDVAAECKYEVLVTDMLSRMLEYKQRVNWFMNFLVAVTRATKPDAVYSFHSQKIIKPADLISNWDSVEKQALYSICNVRLYNISDSAKKELLMDTVGLHSLGLPDFQIRFVDFEANEIAGLLWNYAYYIYDYGDVIENGNTLEGTTTGTKWKCERIVSPLNPERVIISVLPN